MPRSCCKNDMNEASMSYRHGRGIPLPQFTT